MDIEHLTMGDKRRLDRNHLVCATRYANLSDTLFEYLKDHQCFPHLSQVKPKRNFIVNEPPHGKTNNLHRRKQRRRSASQ